MNLIVRPVTDDGMAGFDIHGQFWVSTPDPLDATRVVSSIYSDVRDLTCTICGRGWEATANSLSDQRSWQITDDYVHETCLIRFQGLNERILFYNALCDARIRFNKLKTIPNQYWGDPARNRWAAKPWYSAELLEHPMRFELGARKSVYSVTLFAMGGTVLTWWKSAESAFASDNVTKEFGERRVLLHAYGEDKVREYVQKLADLGGLGAKPL